MSNRLIVGVLELDGVRVGMTGKLVVLAVALTLALATAGAGLAPPASANAGGNPDASGWLAETLGAEKLQQLRERAAAGDVQAVLEAAREVATAGGDPNVSPDVVELTQVYDKSPGPAAYSHALEERALAGDVSAVIEVAKLLEIAGQDPETSEFLGKLTKLYETGPGRAAWEEKLLERARKGDVKAVLDASRAASLASGDPDSSPLVKKLTSAYQDSKQPSDPTPETSPEDRGTGPEEPDSDPNDPGTTPEAKEAPPAEEKEKTVVKTSESASQLDENNHYTVTKTTYYSDGSTSTTVTEKDEDGNVVSEETTTTPATEESLTTGDEGGSFTAWGSLEWTWLDGPTRVEMLGHPTNDPDAGPFTGVDINFDGRPDAVVGHLSGVTDPSPEGYLLGITQSPEQYLNGQAGPETGPPDTRDAQGLGPVSADPGNGPIANPYP
jgi:hypothetical protein